MEIKRSFRSNLYTKIIDCLKRNNLSISEISKETEINWETTRRTLELLKQIGMLGERGDKNKRVFYIKDLKVLDQENENILGLPLTELQRETTLSLFKKIKDIWSKKTSRLLNKTFLQKIAIKTIKENKISDIPFGWYLFGMTCVLQCDPNNISIKQNLIGDTYDKSITKIIEKYLTFKCTYDLMKAQYIEESNDLYLTKLKFSTDLLYEFREDNISFLKKRVLDLAFNFKKFEDNEDIVELIEGFISIFGQLANNLSIKTLEELRPNILETFKALWNCMATYNLYRSLLDNGFYEKDLLAKFYLLNINSLKEICEDYLDFLNDFVPKKEIKDSLTKFKGSQA